MEYPFINLNDTVYRIKNNPSAWNYLNPAAINYCFTKSSCPLLYTYGRERVPTWKDLAIILSGYPNDQFTNSKTASSCFRMYDNCNELGAYRNWGITLGTPAGKNGRPLCEEKILDEGFFYYDNCQKDIFTWRGNGVTSNFAINDSLMFLGSYEGKWYDWYSRDGVATGTNDALITLHPGVYIIIALAYYDSFSFFREMNPNDNTAHKKWLGGIQVNSTQYTDRLKSFNAMIFCDSQVYIRWQYRKGNTNQATVDARVYRLTPPGYWKP